MLSAWLSFALTASAADSGVHSGADISAAARIGTNGCASDIAECEWVNFRDAAVFSPWASAKPNPNVAARGAMDIRVHGPGAGHADLTAPNQTPWSLRVSDAWVSGRSAHTNLTVGVQRIAWGVGQGYSLVDTLNPINLEDPTRFDRRLSVPALDITAHTGPVSFSGVILPFFVPAALPDLPLDLLTGASDLFDSRFSDGNAIDVGSLETRPEIPANTLAETGFATRLRYSPPVGDFALSWHHGRDSLPQVAGDVVLVGFQTKTDAVDVGVPLAFPKQDLFGFTARSSLFGGLNAWGEVLLVLPERTRAAPTAAQLASLVQLGVIDAAPSPIPETITQDGEPLWKWMLGLDGAIGPVRLTTQWLHGFITERSQADLKDYALLTAQWTALPTVRIDATAVSDFRGHVLTAGLTVLHADEVEITMGATAIDGPEGTSLAGLKSASNVHTAVKVSF